MKLKEFLNQINKNGMLAHPVQVLDIPGKSG